MTYFSRIFLSSAAAQMTNLIKLRYGIDVAFPSRLRDGPLRVSRCNLLIVGQFVLPLNLAVAWWRVRHVPVKQNDPSTRYEKSMVIASQC